MILEQQDLVALLEQQGLVLQDLLDLVVILEQQDLLALLEQQGLVLQDLLDLGLLDLLELVV